MGTENIEKDYNEILRYFCNTYPCEGLSFTPIEDSYFIDNYFIPNSYHENFTYFMFGYRFEMAGGLIPDYEKITMETYKDISLSDFLGLTQCFTFLYRSYSYIDILDKRISDNKNIFYTDEEINKNFIFFLEGFLYKRK